MMNLQILEALLINCFSIIAFMRITYVFAPFMNEANKCLGTKKSLNNQGIFSQRFILRYFEIFCWH
jgi:hypothetical protein